MLYLVINIATEERGVFTTARDLCLYMWERDFAQYHIYVCRRFPWSQRDIGALEKALEQAA